MTTPSASDDGLPAAASGLVGAGSELSHLPLRGRESEQRTIDALLDAVDAGASRILIVRGIAGVGKTRLLHEAIDEATRRRWSTVVAAPDVDSHLVPAAALIDAALSGPRPLLTRTEVAEWGDVPDVRYWLTQTFRDALEKRSVDGSILVVVDDLQWADAASLLMLRSLVSSLADLPVLWALAIRSGRHRPEVERTVQALDATATVIDVEPLGALAVNEMATDLLGAVPDEALRRTLDRTDNLPLLVVEVVGGLIEENLVSLDGETASVDAGTLPSRFGTSIRERISRLPSSAARLVQVAAVLGRSFDLPTLAELLGGTDRELVDGVSAAIDADILVDDGRLHFRHDAIREAAEAMLSASTRAHLQRRSVDIRIRAGEPVLAVASSVVSSASPGDEAAVSLLHDAALELAGSDATGAGELAVRAVELSTSDAQHGLLADLLPVLWVSGQADVATELAGTLDRSLPPEGRASVFLAMARLQTESSFGDAIRSSELGLALDDIAPETRANLLAVRALNLANIADHERLPAALAEARAAAEGTDALAALATVDATDSVRAFYESRFEEAGALIRSAVERMATVPGVTAAQWLPEGLWPAFLADSTGDVRRALRIADEGLAETTRRRNAIAMAFWGMVRSRVLLDLGDLEEAKLQAETVMDLAVELGLGDFGRATAGLVLLRVALFQGDRPACDAALASAREMADGESLHLTGSWHLAIAALGDGDAATAVKLSEGAYRNLGFPAPAMTTPADFSDDVQLARMSRDGGARDRLALIVETATDRAAKTVGNGLTAGIAHHVRGIATGDISAFESAVSSLRGCSRPLVLASALEDLGSARATAGADGADTAWAEAADLYESCGATRDAGRALRRLRTVGVRRRPKAPDTHSGMLSAREREIAVRLASGSTTREIALDLYLSPNTVVTHIRHIYSKWGISTRKAVTERARELRLMP